MAFEVRGGEIVGLIGPNGSGKSTVMKCVMGIERPTAGSVRIAGQEVAGEPAHRIARRGVGLVFQHSRPLHRQTVHENIKLALLPDSLLRLFGDPAIDREARAIAERVGLANVLPRRPASAFADADNPLLQVQNLSVFYGKAQALEQVSIHVHEREFVSIVGLNGAGKTTLFNAISGLVPYDGTIAWAGQNLAGRTAAS